MPQSLSHVIIHVIFSTKERTQCLRSNLRPYFGTGTVEVYVCVTTVAPHRSGLQPSNITWT